MSIQRILVFCIAAAAYAQQDPSELLRRLQAKIADSVNRLPRYMCTETIDRLYFNRDTRHGFTPCNETPAQPAAHLSTSDRLRLDVAMASTGEMYSWVGGSRFDDRDLMNLVRDGAIGNGSYAAFLTAIFLHGDADFRYRGEAVEGPRSLAAFTFRVPLERSHYVYSEGSYHVRSGYEGTFSVDPASADLVHLIVRSDPLPADSAACYAETTLDYSRVYLNGADFLLPAESRMRLLHTDGGEARNRTVFSGCHEFLGESTISFGSSANENLPAAPQASPPRLVRIPPGLPFRISINQGIDTSHAAAGDSLKASLTAPIRDGSTVLAPAGAPVAARIVRIRWLYGVTWSLDLRVTIEAVEIGGSMTPLAGATQFLFRNIHPPYLIGSGLQSDWMTVVSSASDK